MIVKTRAALVAAVLSYSMFALVAGSMTGCYELTGECSPGPCSDAAASADGDAGKDQGRVGSSDADAADASDAGSRGSDADGVSQTDVAQVDAGANDSTDASAPDTVTSPCPPAKRPDATIAYAYKGQTLCLSAFEKKAFEILDTHKGVPATKCADFGDPDYCFAEFALTSASSDEGCFDVTMTHPDAPDISYKFTVQKCNATSGLCTHEKEKNGSTKQVIYDANQKLLTYKKFGETGTDNKSYKLVPK